MGKNIEIKARSTDFLKQRELAEKISETSVEVLLQQDIFFQSSLGRLKLRIFSSNCGQLISYRRADIAAVKSSTFSIFPTSEPLQLRQTLTLALGEIGVVNKTRFLYKVGQARIHFDEVKNLGNFIEIEYVLKIAQAENIGEEFVRQLMEKLEILPADLIATAYFDLLN